MAVPVNAVGTDAQRDVPGEAALAAAQGVNLVASQLQGLLSETPAVRYMAHGDVLRTGTGNSRVLDVRCGTSWSLTQLAAHLRTLAHDPGDIELVHEDYGPPAPAPLDPPPNPAAEREARGRQAARRAARTRLIDDPEVRARLAGRAGDRPED